MDYSEIKATAGTDPHELALEIGAAASSPADELRLLLEAFEDKPDTALLMYVKFLCNNHLEELGQTLLGLLKNYLLGPDGEKLQMVLFSLRYEYFEDEHCVAPVWNALAGPGADPRLLQRLLPKSGPVPWPLKYPLLRDLAKNHNWHPVIFQCLVDSTLVGLGQVDKPEARRLLGALRLAPDTPRLTDLKNALDT
jgi:hypothetical protein